jgi:hypothetical protein
MLDGISLGCNGRGAQGVPRKPPSVDDMIDMADYGGGVNYSLIEQNAAIAQWICDTDDVLRKERS